MLDLRMGRHWNFAEFNVLVDKFSPVILGGLLAATTFQKFLLILHYDGGGDLLGADIPKSMMLWSGQNPYSSNPWASPYPPFLLGFVGLIIRVTSGNLIATPDTIGLISRNVRLGGLVADILVAVLIFSVLQMRGYRGLQALIPSAFFVTLPSISLSPYYWFNSDVFGYPILASAVLALVARRYFIGSTLLAAATIFKIHPILAVPMVLVWLVRRQGLSRSLPTILTSTSILLAGLAVPVVIPGYFESILGFNLSSGFGGGTSSFTMMNLVYGILPAVLHVSPSISVDNQVWVATTVSLFAIVLSVIWSRANRMSPVDVVALGLFAWLIPLRQLYTHYLVWAIVPFLMRGRLRQTLVVGFLLELANTMSVWSWGFPPDPFPQLSTVYGFFVTSLAYLSVSATALVFVVRRTTIARRMDDKISSSPFSLERPLVPVARQTRATVRP